MKSHAYIFALLLSSLVTLTGCKEETVAMSPQAESVTADNQALAKMYAEQTNDAILRANPLPTVKVNAVEGEKQTIQLTQGLPNPPDFSKD